jgi:4-diphosphocytidyl-2-C-methyl-D-erythritol kinase
MTGSGSAVFAMYEDDEARDKAYEQIKSDPKFAGCDLFLAKTI